MHLALRGDGAPRGDQGLRGDLAAEDALLCGLGRTAAQQVLPMHSRSSNAIRSATEPVMSAMPAVNRTAAPHGPLSRANSGTAQERSVAPAAASSARPCSRVIAGR